MSLRWVVPASISFLRDTVKRDIRKRERDIRKREKERERCVNVCRWKKDAAVSSGEKEKKRVVR